MENTYKIRNGKISGYVDIKCVDDINSLRDVAFNSKCDELLGFVETVNYYHNSESILLQVCGKFTVPDVIFKYQSKLIGLEVTKLQWQALAQEINTSKGEAIAVTQVLCTDRSLKCIPQSERKTAPGWSGEESIKDAFKLLKICLERKSKKLSEYSKVTPNNWLFLIGNHQICGEWADILESESLKSEVEQICLKSGFERVFFYQWGKNTREGTVSVLYKHDD